MGKRRGEVVKIRDLQMIVAISEMGGLSSAARKLHVTQPALSAHLRRMEDDLKVTLVRRHSRGSRLTEEGKYILQRAYGVLDEMREIRSMVSSAAKQPAGTIRLGLPTTVAGKLIPKIFSSLKTRYPLIQLQVVEAMSGALAELLQMGRLDLAVLYDIKPMAGLVSEPILREKHHLLVSSNHPLAKKEQIRFDEVSRLGIVIPSTEHYIRRHLDDICSAEGLTLKVIGEINSLPGLVGLVQEGFCTILPTFIVTEQISAGTIVAIRITRPEISWTAHLAFRHDVLRLSANIATGRHLVNICEELVASKIWPGIYCGATKPNNAGNII
jgi:LysR family nitrogen assimilation transcriptional regulator